MDQLRTALSWLKRHHFWVLSGLAALIAFGCWWMASGKVSKLYAANQATITTEFKTLKTVRDSPFHPNDVINQRQDVEMKKQTDSVTKLWEQLYEKQRETVLKWPVQLSKAFLDAVEKMQFGDEISLELRNNYQNYIASHFSELPKQIGAREMLPTETGVGAEMPRGRMPYGPEGAGIPGIDSAQDDDYICEWLDQNTVRNDLEFRQRPSSQRIWKTQEDLWVYHALLDAIARTNQSAGATRKSNAAVKTVVSLEVGQRAAYYSRTPGRLLVQPPIAAAAAPGAEGGSPLGPGGGPEGAGRGMPPREMMMPGEGRGGNFGTGGVMSPADEQRFLFSDRYLDEKGQPIPVGGGAAAAGGEPSPSPEPAPAADLNAPAPPLDMSQFGVCFKRLPVRMVLEMDGRWLPQLIANCANESLRVEVQEVRINAADIEGLAAGGAGGMRFGGERGPGIGGGAGANLFPDRTGLQSFPQQPNVITVAIQGTIYIYNKPNPELLKSSTEQPATEQPPAEQPAPGA